MLAKDITKNILAAVFFLFGIGMVFLFIMTIGRDKGFAKAQFEISAIFKNVGGIIEGAPVRLAGVSIGSVSSIDFLPKAIEGRAVEVKMKIFEKYKPLLQNEARYMIRTEGILGEKLIEIFSVSEEPMDFSKPIIGEDPLDVADLAAVFAKTAEAFSKTAEDIGEIDMSELAVVMEDTSRSLLITSEGIREILGEMRDITIKSKRLFDRIEQKIIDGNLFKVF